jgi:hypothetical protein
MIPLVQRLTSASVPQVDENDSIPIRTDSMLMLLPTQSKGRLDREIFLPKKTIEVIKIEVAKIECK